ncbi:hypothetical protein [Roseibium sp.]|uniref:hypothetical protein n=1 Tax=Roseibium sp. TaxID=1936156 RepID=UPI003D0A9E24
MTKTTAPLTYRDQALLVGYTFLGEGMDFIAAELGRSALATELAYKDILATLQGVDHVPPVKPVSDDHRPKTTPPVAAASSETRAAYERSAGETTSHPAKWQPRRFRTLPSAVRQAQRGTRDVTAALMGDPSAAAYERSLARPATKRDAKHPAKWS